MNTRKALVTHQNRLKGVHEELAKSLAENQRFDFPLAERQIDRLQKLVDAIYPDMNNKVYQIDEDKKDGQQEGQPPYLGFTTSPSLTVDQKWLARMFSYFFVKPIGEYGNPLGWANKRAMFFAFAEDCD
jgi:hypothetical protein